MSKLAERLENRLGKVLEEFGFEKEMGGAWLKESKNGTVTVVINIEE